MNVAEKITQFLSTHPDNVVTVTQGNYRLAKSEAPKYGFSLNDIKSKFGSSEAFIKSLPNNGFTSGANLDFRRLYFRNGKQNSYKMDSLTLTFKKEEEMTPNEVPPSETTMMPNAPIVSQQPQPTIGFSNTPTASMATQNMPNAMGYPMGLGYTPVATTDWISSKVTEERYRDLLRDNDTLREDNKDLRSQVRVLHEEKAALKLQLDTADKKHELQLKEEILNKKSFWESPGFEKVSEALGSIVPFVIEKVSASSAAATAVPALAQPNTSLSETKQAFMRIIASPHVSDEQVNLLYEYLQQAQSLENEQTRSN
ncbi:hypothetical protein [Capnocytophaga sp. oral taxon 878]|uniref:hypothetical protein n=1 Tax=Capnocytophaga sp. oral taxon 878 TaxID=1316596 RepID=UPI000D03C794|nr:hypothetical protein [Capnocytophaga sp. oral taxon 878]AVM49313.1 hypothetical protein C4H12_01840 [Capnocytophaga sp. oral taxon 878]